MPTPKYDHDVFSAVARGNVNKTIEAAANLLDMAHQEGVFSGGSGEAFSADFGLALTRLITEALMRGETPEGVRRSLRAHLREGVIERSLHHRQIREAREKREREGR
jgi:hypothetical protein